MATPLFKPLIETVLQAFLAEQAGICTKTVLEQQQDVLHYFRQYLDQEGPGTLTEKTRPRWQEALDAGQRFAQVFSAERMLPAVPGFLQDLTYQQSLLPAGTLINAEKTMHALGRFLLARELCSEKDYLLAVEAMPVASSQLDSAELLGSLLFDFSRDEPPMGKVLEEARGYLEIKKVQRGALTLLSIARNDIAPYVKVPQEASSLARSGWWIEGRLVQTPQGWLFVDVGSVLP